MIVPLHTKVPGRARFRVDALYRSPACQQCLETQLRQHPQIRHISANPVTGNVLVKFDPILSVTELAQRIANALPT
ncbi:MAG: HMA2 domain-containing protein, partial [Synechocystis sp.]